jgi:hypothetical protein
MKLYHPGDKSLAVCEDCKALVTTTFGYHDVPFSDGKGTAKGILAASCDACGKVVSIPAQSTPAIAKAREQADLTFEVKLAAPEMEVLDAVAFRIDRHATTRFRKAVLTYYIGMLDEKPDLLGEMTAGIEAWIGQCKAIQQKANLEKKTIPIRRLSMKISPLTECKFNRVAETTGLSRTDLVRGILMLSKRDVLDLDLEGVSLVMRDLKVIADTVNG